jgi:hypothetical protein
LLLIYELLSFITHCIIYGVPLMPCRSLSHIHSAASTADEQTKSVTAAEAAARAALASGDVIGVDRISRVVERIVEGAQLCLKIQGS